MRGFLDELTRRCAKWIVVVGTLWGGHVLYILATTELWWRTA